MRRIYDWAGQTLQLLPRIFCFGACLINLPSDNHRITIFWGGSHEVGSRRAGALLDGSCSRATAFGKDAIALGRFKLGCARQMRAEHVMHLMERSLLCLA